MRRTIHVGLGPVEVAPQSTEKVQLWPSAPFQGERLIATCDTTGLYIENIFVGDKSQLPTFANPIRLDTYRPDAIDNELWLDECDGNKAITIHVKNLTDTPRTFSCSIVGKERTGMEGSTDVKNEPAAEDCIPPPPLDEVFRFTSKFEPQPLQQTRADRFLAYVEVKRLQFIIGMRKFLLLAQDTTHQLSLVIAEATRRQKPKKPRNYVVGFGPVIVPPKQTVTVQHQPQLLFKGEQIAPVGNCDDLFVQGLYIGQKSQLPTFSAPIPLASFKAQKADLHMDTCDPALFITFQIQNNSDVERTFACAIFGKAAVPW